MTHTSNFYQKTGEIVKQNLSNGRNKHKKGHKPWPRMSGVSTKGTTVNAKLV